MIQSKFPQIAPMPRPRNSANYPRDGVELALKSWNVIAIARRSTHAREVVALGSSLQCAVGGGEFDFVEYYKGIGWCRRCQADTSRFGSVACTCPACTCPA